jgi:hypothetical protein
MTQHNTTARASRRADGHFTTIANAALRDPRLSWKAKGVLAGALSHGPGFRFKREWFIRNSTDGESAIRSAFVELREHGYLANERQMGEGGRFVSGGLHFTDDPAMHAEIHVGENLLVENPPGGEPPTIRRSIERTTTEEHQVELEPPTPYGGFPPEGETHGQDAELVAFRAALEGRAPSGTLAVDPQPQRPDPAPSPPKRKRVAKPKPPAFHPTPDDVPAALLPVQDTLLAFWAEKDGSNSERAWTELLGDLQLIWAHPNGGTEVVRAQLSNGIQNGWQSITFSNWQKYGQTALAPVGGSRRGSATMDAAQAAIAMYHERGIA